MFTADQNLTPFESRLLTCIASASRRSGGRPATTLAICEAINHAAPLRTVQYYLKTLEDRGHLERITARTGWRIKRSADEPSIISVAAQQRDPSRWLADQIGCDRATAYRALNRQPVQ